MLLLVWQLHTMAEVSLPCELSAAISYFFCPICNTWCALLRRVPCPCVAHPCRLQQFHRDILEILPRYGLSPICTVTEHVAWNLHLKVVLCPCRTTWLFTGRACTHVSCRRRRRLFICLFFFLPAFSSHPCSPGWTHTISQLTSIQYMRNGEWGSRRPPCPHMTFLHAHKVGATRLSTVKSANACCSVDGDSNPTCCKRCASLVRVHLHQQYGNCDIVEPRSLARSFTALANLGQPRNPLLLLRFKLNSGQVVKRTESLPVLPSIAGHLESNAAQPNFSCSSFNARTDLVQTDTFSPFILPIR